MIKIRLERSGVRNKPFYRLIVTSKERKKGGKSLDAIGFWHPGRNLKKINKKKLSFWLTRGAKMTHKVSKLCGN